MDLQNNWNTEYNNGITIHRADNGVEIVTNLNEMTSKIFKNQNLIAKDRTPEKVTDYTNYLLKIFNSK